MFQYWAGGVMAAGGLGLLWVAALRRRHAKEAAARGEVPPPLHPSLAPLADIGPPIIIFGLFVAGGQAAIAFLLTGGGGVFSLFDLAGFLVLLVGYGVWVKAKVAHRAGTYRG